jgi:hypothetical protein
MWTAVLWNLAGFLSFALLLIWLRYRLALAENAVEEAHANRALGPQAEMPAAKPEGRASAPDYNSAPKLGNKPR